jgi:hypothetical protein
MPILHIADAGLIKAACNAAPTPGNALLAHMFRSYASPRAPTPHEISDLHHAMVHLTRPDDGHYSG